MDKLEIIGYKRANLGKREANELRFAGSIPSVLYGGDEQIHFHAPTYLFKDLVYTEKPHFVDLLIEGKVYEAKLQEVQFHPVSEMLMHADFLLLKADSLITMEIPVKFEGTAPGVVKGGKLNHKLRKLKVKALPKDMPGEITLDISALDLGKSAKVGDVKTENYTIINAKAIPVVTVEVPRALKGGEEAGK